MDAATRSTYLAECFWPDVSPAAVEEVAARVRRSARELTDGGTAVALRGSIVLLADEVVLYLFGGSSLEAVQDACARAGVPVERVVESVERFEAPTREE